MIKLLLHLVRVVFFTIVLNGIVIGAVQGLQGLSDDGHSEMSFVLLIAIFVLSAKVFGNNTYELKEQETKHDQ